MDLLISFLDNSEWSFYQFPLLIALVISTFINIKLRIESIPKFTYFLFYFCFVEFFLANYFMIYYGSNTAAYNIHFVLTTFYYYYIFIIDNTNKILSSVYLFMFYGFLGFTVFNFVCFQGVFEANSFTFIFGMLMVLFALINYFKRVLDQEIIAPVYLDPVFILCLGVLAIYTTSFPLIANISSIANLPYEAAMVFFKLIELGNFFLALSFIYIALCPILKQHWSKK